MSEDLRPDLFTYTKVRKCTAKCKTTYNRWRHDKNTMKNTYRLTCKVCGRVRKGKYADRS